MDSIEENNASVTSDDEVTLPDPSDSLPPDPQPIVSAHLQIAGRAYFIWLDSGYVPARELDNWVTAEWEHRFRS